MAKHNSSDKQPCPKIEHAIRALLHGLGYPPTGDLEQTPARAARLWTEHLLAGHHTDLASALGTGVSSDSRGPVVALDIGVHLVCPHHLTVALGTAHVAYAPSGRLAGFGSLARLVQACTARLTLQEDATARIADALVEHLGAHAAVAMIEAAHPCHNVPYGHSHGAQVVTWSNAGDADAARSLRDLISTGLVRRRDNAARPSDANHPR